MYLQRFFPQNSGTEYFAVVVTMC